MTGRPNRRLARRRLLGSVATGGIAALAGCVSGAALTGDGPLSVGSLAADGLFGGSGDGLDGIDQSKLDDRPITGQQVPELAALDEAMLSYMDERTVPTGALGVARDGEIVLQRGYGWQDRSLSEPVAPDALFRIGSISKAITEAVVYRLVSDGQLSYDDRIVPLLDVEPPRGTVADERVHDITVQHLVNHRGGWDRTETSDPPFQPRVITDRLGTTPPPTTEDLARWVLDTPLQFDPGTRQEYSNVGYALLELVVERVTGRDYNAIVRALVLDPAGIDDVYPGVTHRADRPDREIWYADPTSCPDITTSASGDSVACADGGFTMSLLRAAAGHVASTTGLLSFLDSYWLSGAPRAGGSRSLWQYGSLPGAFAWSCQRSDNVRFVALFNRRGDEPETIGDRLNRAIDGIDDWP
jgi:N-acyl-D-amino-acid deacylase